MLHLSQDKENEEPVPQRPRPVVTQGNKKMLPFVIKWAGGGNNVSIAGTFNQWQSIPMVKRCAGVEAQTGEGSSHHYHCVQGLHSSIDNKTITFTVALP